MSFYNITGIRAFPIASSGCGDPGTPENGRRLGNDFAVGSEVVYVCNSDFSLDGSRIRICQANFTWTGVLPTCQSKWYAIVCVCVCVRMCVCVPTLCVFSLYMGVSVGVVSVCWKFGMCGVGVKICAHHS